MSLSARRAWIEIPAWAAPGRAGWSLSARRAWIEMRRQHSRQPLLYVALRKESVDRNPLFVFRPPESEVSLSARRAWIEIFLSVFAFGMPTVALRKESVDRN